MMLDDWQIMTLWLMKHDWLLMADDKRWKQMTKIMTENNITWEMTTYERVQKMMIDDERLQRMIMDDSRWQHFSNDRRWWPMTEDERWPTYDNQWPQMTTDDYRWLQKPNDIKWQMATSSFQQLWDMISLCGYHLLTSEAKTWAKLLKIKTCKLQEKAT